MKKRMLLIISLALVGLAGCSKNGTADTNIPTATPTTTVTEEPKPEEVSATPTPAVENTLRIADFYPMEADTEYVYDGEGNEYAAYTRTVDYIDETKNRIQTRTQNGGTETVRVMELKDGTLSVVYSAGECYYRENFLDRTQEKPEVLLMEPLNAGTEWTLPDGRKRSITSTNTALVTSYGSFRTLEVTTEEENAVTKDYYAAGVGLVQSLYQSKETNNGMKVSSTLSRVNKNAKLTQTLRIFNPDSEERINERNAELTFQTGEDAKEKLEEVFLQKPSENELPLLSEGTKINNLSVDSEGILNADLSQEFLTGMNLGSGYEQLVLQSLADTLGGYFGVSRVRITIDGKPYESGHISMDIINVSQ